MTVQDHELLEIRLFCIELSFNKFSDGNLDVCDLIIKAREIEEYITGQKQQQCQT